MKLFKLALKNIKKSLKDYSIYFFTLVVAVAVFYSFNSIDSQTAMMTLNENKMAMVKSLISVINTFSVFVAVVLGFLIVYANNFLIKRRKKEIGIYLTLGMSKLKVSIMIVLETIIVGIFSLLVGLLLGIGLSQLFSIFTAKLFEVDMTKFAFIFSYSALKDAVINFGIIYVIVLIFNVLTLNRFKLIDLLYANKKNEKVKIKNSWFIFITFIVSIGLIGYAYKLLYDGVLMVVSSDFGWMLIYGSVGTFLFFYSVAGFLLKVIQMRKKTYYHGLNMFVLKQVNNTINTSVISTTIISLMLLLTIGILASSLSMASAMNDTFKDNCPNDFTLYTGEITNLQELRAKQEYQDIIKEDYQYAIINIEGLTQGKFIDYSNEKYVNMDFINENPISIIKQSDYNKIVTMQGKKDQVISLAENQYQLVANLPIALEMYHDFIEKDGVVKINDLTLSSATNKIIELAINNGSGNEGFIVVNDKTASKYGQVSMESYLIGNYQGDVNKSEAVFNNLIKQSEQEYGIQYFSLFTRIDLSESAIGSSALFTFVGLYLGIVFAISSGTVLAIEQLSKSADNKERYRILNQLGASKPMINKSLLYQIGISFMFPLVVALIHSFVGLSEVNRIIKLMANINIMDNIVMTVIFMVIVYGGYYLATYLASNRIINEH